MTTLRDKRRQAMGQHFLRDPRVIEAIISEGVSHALEQGAQSLLEIGPGKGAITNGLLAQKKQFRRFFVAEKDYYFIESWNQAEPDLEILEGDFVQVPFEKWNSPAPLAVISNLPYSSGTAIFTKLAAHPETICSMTLMFQAEVAERLRATPKTKAWGSLSVWTQNRWSIKQLLEVPPQAFIPPPKVRSEVVQCTPLAQPQVIGTDTEMGEKIWEDLLKVSFMHRRKMLRSSLTGVWLELLHHSQVDPTLRAEALGWNHWQALFDSALALIASRKEP